MIRKAMIFLFCLSLVTASFSPSSLNAQVKSAYAFPDIGIMNGILGQLMQGVYGTYDPIDVYGCYLPGYGLLFVVNPPYKGLWFDFGNLADSINVTTSAALSSAMVQLDSTMRRFDSSMSQYRFPYKRIGQVPKVRFPEIEKRSKPKNDYSEGQFDAVIRFLRSYADAVNKLSPEQKITVVVLTDYESAGRTFSVTRKNVTSFRSGSLTETQFKTEVDTTALKEESEGSPVGIMSGILNELLGRRLYVESYVPATQNTRGVYVKGVGVVFSGQLQSGWKNEGVDTRAVERKIVQVLGDYGSSLRFLPGNESVIVLLNLETFVSSKKEMLISLKKSDIDSYIRDQINLNMLEQRATLLEYE